MVRNLLLFPIPPKLGLIKVIRLIFPPLISKTASHHSDTSLRNCNSWSEDSGINVMSIHIRFLLWELSILWSFLPGTVFLHLSTSLFHILKLIFLLCGCTLYFSCPHLLFTILNLGGLRDSLQKVVNKKFYGQSSTLLVAKQPLPPTQKIIQHSQDSVRNS